MKKRDLIDLLKFYNDDDEIVIAPLPGMCGWVHDLSPDVYQVRNESDKVVLSLKEETISSDELVLEKR